MTELQRIGIVLAGLGLVLLAVAAWGASRNVSTRESKPVLEWLWEQLLSMITDLLGANKKWFERVAALGKICLLLGLAFVFSPMYLDGNGPDAPQPQPDSTRSADSTR